MSEGRPIRYRGTEPMVSPLAAENVRQVLAEGYLSPGQWVGRFEQAWARECGVAFGVATSTGTAALHMALVAAGIGEGDEVIVPAMTCPDTLNAVVFAGATPVIVDIERERLGMDADRMVAAITPRTRAVMPVHLYGVTVRPEVFAEARARGLMVIEDAAEAHGAQLAGRRAGALGHAGCFSFRGDKMLGVGTGGMVTTDDEALARRVRYLIGLASPGGFDRYLSTERCYSYEMSNVHAAIGVAQVGMLDETIAAKRRIARWYDELLADSLADRPAPVDGHVYWRYPVLVRRGDTRRLHARLGAQGVEALPPFVPMYRLPQFSAGLDPASFPVAEDVYRRLLCLPISPHLTRAEAEDIARLFREAVEADA